jgi:peptide deformylase
MPLKIVQYGDPVLRKKGRPVAGFDAKLAKLAADMVETMHLAEGIGLAAQQIGLALQLCVIDLRGTETPSTWLLDGSSPPLDLIMPMALVNPTVEVVREPTTSYEEGCLSFPGVRGDVVRPDRARVRFQDVQGHIHELTCTGLLSRCVQHEIDHLNGVLFIDRMSKATLALLEESLKELKAGLRPKPR